MSSRAAAPAGDFGLLTAPGPAAIAILRVRGPRTPDLLLRHLRAAAVTRPDSWSPGRAFRATLVDEQDEPLDDILVSVHAPGPAWEVRLHLHGQPQLIQRVAALLRGGGFVESRAAPPSLWAPRDALEGEAWALLPRLLTLRGARWLLEQPARLREVITALGDPTSRAAAQQTCRQAADRLGLIQWFITPLRVALVGPPNAGKSTLVNALADRAVSVVAPRPGTTRDWVEAPGEIDGYPVTWIDTAGLRESPDALEAAGAARTHDILAQADAVVVVLDVTPDAAVAGAAFLECYSDLAPVCIALNKCDAGDPAPLLATLPPPWRPLSIPISALGHTGLPALQQRLLARTGRDAAELAQPAAFTPRQADLLRAAPEHADDKPIIDKLLHAAAEPDFLSDG